jgi:hypothetical protein
MLYPPSTLKMEAVPSSEAFLYRYQGTRNHVTVTARQFQIPYVAIIIFIEELKAFYAVTQVENIPSLDNE